MARDGDSRKHSFSRLKWLWVSLLGSATGTGVAGKRKPPNVPWVWSEQSGLSMPLAEQRIGTAKAWQLCITPPSTGTSMEAANQTGVVANPIPQSLKVCQTQQDVVKETKIKLRKKASQENGIQEQEWRNWAGEGWVMTGWTCHPSLKHEHELWASKWHTLHTPYPLYTQHPKNTVT